MGWHFFFHWLRYKKKSSSHLQLGSSFVVILVTLFRDATLWRETVEYMLDHHQKGYPYTIKNMHYRQHAIVCLWTVNILWLVAPCLTVIWAYQQIVESKVENLISEKKKKTS